MSGPSRSLVLATLLSLVPHTGTLSAGTFAPVLRSPLPGIAEPGLATLVDAMPGGPVLVVATGAGIAPAPLRNGVFVLVDGLPAGLTPVAIASGDLDGDGWADVVVAARRRDGTGLLVPFTGDGRGAFRVATPFECPVPGSAAGLALADLDGDGAADVVVARTELTVLSGRTRAVLSTTPLGATQLDIAAIRLVDVDQDGRLDVVSAVQPFNAPHPGVPRRVVTSLGDGRGGFRPLPPLDVDAVPWESVLAVGDLDGDGPSEIVGASWDVFTGRASVETFRRGPGGLTLGAVATLPARAAALATLDADGDGRADLLVGDELGRLLLLCSRPAGLSAPVTLDAPAAARLVGATDVDGDGRADLVLATPRELVVLRRRDTAELFLPVVLSTDRYRTELVLVNHGPRAAALEWTYRASAGSGSGRATDTLEAGRQRVVPDAFAYLGALGMAIPTEGNRLGTLRADVSGLDAASDVGLLARVVNDRPDGVAGVSLPALAPGGLLSADSSTLFLAETPSERTNLALVNAGRDGDGEITLRVTVGASSPLDVRLRPGEWRQLDRVLTHLAPGEAVGSARIERVDGGAPWFAYAVVNDAVTDDGTYLAAVPDEQVRDLLFPVVVLGEQPFHTELLLGRQQGPLSIAIRGTAGVESAGSGPTTRLGLRETGSPSAGPAVVRIATLDPFATLSTSAAARVTATAPGGGRYGVAAPALDLRRAARRAAWVNGLRRDATTRSNLAISVPGGDATFTLELFDGDSGAVVAVEERAVSRFAQWSLAALLPAGSPVRSAYARVTFLSGQPGFVAYGVVNDGAAPGLGTGDGSFLTMQSDIDP